MEFLRNHEHQIERQKLINELNDERNNLIKDLKHSRKLESKESRILHKKNKEEYCAHFFSNIHSKNKIKSKIFLSYNSDIFKDITHTLDGEFCDFIRKFTLYLSLKDMKKKLNFEITHDFIKELFTHFKFTLLFSGMNKSEQSYLSFRFSEILFMNYACNSKDASDESLINYDEERGLIKIPLVNFCNFNKDGFPLFVVKYQVFSIFFELSSKIKKLFNTEIKMSFYAWHDRREPYKKYFDFRMNFLASRYKLDNDGYETLYVFGKEHIITFSFEWLEDFYLTKVILLNTENEIQDIYISTSNMPNPGDDLKENEKAWTKLEIKTIEFLDNYIYYICLSPELYDFDNLQDLYNGKSLEIPTGLKKSNKYNTLLMKFIYKDKFVTDPQFTCLTSEHVLLQNGCVFTLKN